MSDKAYVGSRKGLFTISRDHGSNSWSVTDAAFLGDNVTLVQPDLGNGRLYAALDHGHFGVKLHRSDDAGQSWKECAVPEYPEPPAGVDPDKCPMSGVTIPWKLKLIWAIAFGGSRQDGVIWCGTVPGALFRSNDHGESWEMIRALWDEPGRKQWFGGGLDYPGIHSICVHPQNPDHITVGVSCGGVWISNDGGTNWKCQADGMRAAYMPPDQANDPGIQDPHCVVQCKAHPDTYWAQHHNGVFKTSNGCKSWSEIPDIAPSAFGFAVAVHPNDPDMAWLVPAIKDEKRIPVDGKVVVTRTRDGGKTFDILRNGLPQEYAYDLTFRHALDIDATGERLMFGSTTGSLWVTEDQGDSWQTISSTLPPVHSVRFATT